MHVTRERVFALFIFLIALCTRIISINFPFGDYDEGVYVATVRSILHGFPVLTGTYISQSPLLYYLSIPLYSLTHAIGVLRLIPVSFSLIIISLSFFVVKKYVGVVSACFISLYLSFNGIFLLVSRTYQLDMPWLGATFLSFFFLILFHEKKSELYLLLSGIAFGISLMIKANPMFLFVLLAYTIFIFQKGVLKGIYEIVLFIFATLLPIIAVISPTQWNIFYHQVIAIRVTEQFSFASLISPVRVLFIKHEAIILLLAFLSLGYGIYTGIKCRKIYRFLQEHIFLFLTSCWFIISLIVIGVYNPLFEHHLVYAILPVTLMASFIVEVIYERVRGLRYIEIGYFIVLLFILIFSARYSIHDLDLLFPQPSAYTNDLSRIASYIDAHSAFGDYVITDNQVIQYLANRDTPPGLVDTSFVRIATGNLNAHYAIEQTDIYHVKIIVLQSDRLAELTDYVTYLQKNYHEVMVDGATVFEK